MLAEVKSSFAFLVLAYNHEEYILEHLESIKFLVQTYGADWEVDLIINDDCSRDKTTDLVECWLSENRSIFRCVRTFYNSENLGTCASVNQMLEHMLADRCKITAGDDVYSYENIFELTRCSSDVAMLSGRVLFLKDNELKDSRISNMLASATQVIYGGEPLINRFKRVSYVNAPNLLYATECLMHQDVRSYLMHFDVVEDWPIQVAIGRKFYKYRFELIDQVLVYYRRTSGSTYIAASQRFVRDKVSLFQDLIDHESDSIVRFLLRNRRYCFKSRHKFVNKLLNLDRYIFAVRCVVNFYKILTVKFVNKLSTTQCDQHYRHYGMIKASSQRFLAKHNFNKRLDCDVA